MLNKSKYIFLMLGFILLSLKGCFFKKPEFPIEPAIAFESIKKVTIKGNQNELIKDSITISITFRDGDGDLGLAPTDTLPPYKALNEDETPNKFHFNYFCTLYRKVKGEFVKFEFPDPALNNNGRYPLLNDDDKLGPLEGILAYNVNIPLQNNIFKENDTLMFKIQIADRALHLSNEIETAEIVIKQKD